MSEHIPRRPTGSSAEAQFFQAVWEKLWGSGRIVSGPGVQVKKTTRGVVITAPEKPGGGTTSTPCPYG